MADTNGMEKKFPRKAGAAGAGERYTKEQLLASERYRGRRDLLSAVLEDGESCDFTAADKKMNEFMKGKVN